MPETRTVPKEGDNAYNGGKIRDLRQLAGLSVAELGGRIDRHPNSVRNIELNKKNASVVILARIADALGVDLCVIADVSAIPVCASESTRRAS